MAIRRCNQRSGHFKSSCRTRIVPPKLAGESFKLLFAEVVGKITWTADWGTHFKRQVPSTLLAPPGLAGCVSSIQQISTFDPKMCSTTSPR
jgi:hypothetical protein